MHDRDDRSEHLGAGVDPADRRPAVLLDIGGLRLLTEPAADAAGPVPGGDRAVAKATALAVAAGEAGPIDAAPRSHDQHGDNLDRSGRALVANAVELTTPEDADRLGHGVACDDRPRVIAAGERVTR